MSIEAVQSAFFTYGVDRIGDEKIRDTVETIMLRIIDPAFWTEPASVSGLYHAGWQNEVGGLVRHVVEMLVLAPRVADIYPGLRDQAHLDMILAAITLHDSCKGGRPWVRGSNAKDHAALAADVWTQVSGVMGVPEVARDIVREAVLFHAGRFSPGGWPADVRPHTRVVHALDMCLSAKELELLFIPKELSA